MKHKNFDIVLPFHFKNGYLRGRFSRIGDVADKIICQHNYPVAVGGALCESIALATILASSLDYDGVFSLQAQGNGPISLIVVDIDDEQKIRAYAKFDKERLENAQRIRKVSNEIEPTPHLLGAGHLAFMVEQGKENYQGVVALEGNSLADCAHQYFKKSEQIETAIKITVAPPSENNGWKAGAMMIQKIPEEGGLKSNNEDDELWRTAVIFMGSLTNEEMLDSNLSGEKVVNRLYHNDGLILSEPRKLTFGCRCSREKIVGMLKTFSPKEIEDMKEPNGCIVVTCQFCSACHSFDNKELGKIVPKVN